MHIVPLRRVPTHKAPQAGLAVLELVMLELIVLELVAQGCSLPTCPEHDSRKVKAHILQGRLYLAGFFPMP